MRATRQFHFVFSVIFLLGTIVSQEKVFAAAGNASSIVLTNRSGIKLLSKEVFIRHRNGRPPATGFVTYVSKTKPNIIHCHGWEDYSDRYDDYSVRLS